MDNKGLLYGIAAYTAWGLLPVYWKAIQALPALEILGHRMVWSLLFLLLLLGYRRQWGWLRPTLRNKRLLLTYLVTAVLLAINWWVYIWAVNAGFIVEASLGYFISPLVNVLMGVFFLGERLRPWQLIAVASATIGVLYLTITFGSLPWIGLVLALTFGTYGLLRKKAPLESIEGLSLEMGLMFLPALAYLIYLEVSGTAVFPHTTFSTNLLVSLVGAATALPLLWFGTAAHRVTLTTLGILQYIAPTGQFLIGVLVYGEPFPPERLIGYSLIWVALVIYTAERIVLSRRSKMRFARP
ncbi:MAG: EamA family transporter RarD [Ardenticatenaceae bacterium]|nr:EamA family transporter RarD [Anaerolineales bacterium]MCB8921770.1 EamA family transporter RarD [Ardenticatenaceae bacterium]MCB8990711.1 EamA family transporter RarD [Ardenticatenaceae bacterium]